MKGLASILSWTLTVQSCAGFFSVSFGVKNVLQLLLIIISPMFQHSPDECHPKQCSERLQSWLPIANIQTKNKNPQHGTEWQAIHPLAKLTHHVTPLALSSSCWKKRYLTASSRNQGGSLKALGELIFPFCECLCLTAIRFWLVSTHSGGKEKVCQWNIYLALGEFWGAVTKSLFLAPEIIHHLFPFLCVFNSHLLQRWIRLKGSHLQKGRKPKGNIFWESHSPCLASS